MLEGTKVMFCDWNRKGQEVVFTGTILDVFRDPEDYRDSCSVRIDADCAEYENQVMTPYLSDVRSFGSR